MGGVKYCVSCGAKIRAGAKSCPVCGESVAPKPSARDASSKRTVPGSRADVPNSYANEDIWDWGTSSAGTKNLFDERGGEEGGVRRPTPTRKKKNLSTAALIGVIAGVAAIIAAAVLALVVFDVLDLFGGDSTKPADILSLGEKFLMDLDYEQAIVQFERLVEIEPKNPRGYTGLAEAYSALGETDKARRTLELGLENTDGSRVIQRALDRLRSSAGGGATSPSPSQNPQNPIESSVDAGSSTTAAPPSSNYNPAPTFTPTPIPTATSGTIEIKSVTPYSATPGVETQFTVTVEYTKIGGGDCVIYVGANTNEYDSFSLIDEYITSDASGTHTFYITCVPEEWIYADFEIYANISAYPHSDSWSPFDTDTYYIAPAAPSAPITVIDFDDFATITATGIQNKWRGIDMTGYSEYGISGFICALFFDDDATISFDEDVRLEAIDSWLNFVAVDIDAGEVVSIEDINGYGAMLGTAGDRFVYFVQDSNPGFFMGLGLLSDKSLSTLPATVTEP